MRIFMRTCIATLCSAGSAVGILALGAALNTLANPHGMTVQSGSATASGQWFATDHHHFAECLPELAELQHRRR